MADVGELAHIYRRLVGARIRSVYQYRASFWMFFAAQFVVTFADFIAIAVIFSQVDELAGWSLAEVAFLYGLTGVSFALADMTISQVETIADRVKLGTFDLLLIRPLGSLFQLAADDFALRRIGKVLQAAVVLTIAINRLDIDWTAGRIALVPITIVAGAVIFGAVWVATTSICFWAVDSREAANAFTYGGNFMTQFPLSIYGVWIRRIMAFAVPLAFVNYFPAVAILDKHDPFSVPDWVHYMSPVVAALAALGAAAIWRTGIRHYRSTGS